MAVILVLVCGWFSFATAVGAVLWFDASLTQALGIWMSGGFVALALAALPALVQRPKPCEDRQAESA